MDRRSALLLTILVCLRLMSAAETCFAQSDPAEEAAKVKSAFLLNFFRYTTWPDSSFENNEAPLVITVVGDTRVLPYLRLIVEQERVGGRLIKVQHLTIPYVAREHETERNRERIAAFHEALKHSHMVFLAEAEGVYIERVLDALAGSSTLTVSDSPTFVENSGMLELKQWRGRIVFDANLDAIEASSVKVSSKVLKLARVVKRKDDR